MKKIDIFSTSSLKINSRIYGQRKLFLNMIEMQKNAIPIVSQIKRFIFLLFAFNNWPRLTTRSRLAKLHCVDKAFC